MWGYLVIMCGGILFGVGLDHLFMPGWITAVSLMVGGLLVAFIGVIVTNIELENDLWPY